MCDSAMFWCCLLVVVGTRATMTHDRYLHDTPPKVLEAYMGEVVWPHLPEAERYGLHEHWRNVRP